MRTGIFGIGLVCSALGCNVDSLLETSPPLGTQTRDNLENATGSQALFTKGTSRLFTAFVGANGVLTMLDLFGDEFTAAGSMFESIDARRTSKATNSISEPGNWPLAEVFGARSELLLATQLLAKYQPSTEMRKVGHAYALIGYSELILAEAYCAGAPLDRVHPDGGIIYGEPLTTDSLLGVAIAHFDSALAYANNDATVIGLASIGLARARLGRGQYAEARTAVTNVTSAFVYNIQTPVDHGAGNLYHLSSRPGIGCSNISVSDREGGNGLPFASSADPRLVLDTVVAIPCFSQWGGTSRLTPVHFPMKFGLPSTLVPLATGIEARLIEAEAALRADSPTWLTMLNALRTTCVDAGSCPSPAPAGIGGVAGLAPLSDPGTPAERVDLLFRERAFWLFGTGIRVGDMRRLVRQYQRPADTVFPVGAYAGGVVANLPTYGSHTSITLPTRDGGATIVNPRYRGCMPEVPTT